MVVLAAVGKSTLALKATPMVLAKIFFSCACLAAALYYLNTGKKRRELERLIWGGVFALLSALVFAL